MVNHSRRDVNALTRMTQAPGGSVSFAHHLPPGRSGDRWETLLGRLWRRVRCRAMKMVFGVALLWIASSPSGHTGTE